MLKKPKTINGILTWHKRGVLSRKPLPPSFGQSSSRPPGRRAAILGEVSGGAARVQNPEKVSQKTTFFGQIEDSHFLAAFFEHPIYFNLLFIVVVWVSSKLESLAKYELYKIFYYKGQNNLDLHSYNITSGAL